VFTVSDGSLLSLADIESSYRRGTSVVRSAHIGNFDAVTLFLAGEGFPVLLDEHAVGTMRGYRPAFVRRAGHEIQIADNPEVPATHLRSRPDTLREIGLEARSPAVVHHRSLVPWGNVVLTSTHLLDQEPFLVGLLEVLAERHPHSFRRFVGRDGSVYTHSRSLPSGTQIYTHPDGAALAIPATRLPELTLGTLRWTKALFDGPGPPADGILLGVDADLLLLTVCEIYRGRNGVERFRRERLDVIHLAGRRMMSYLIRDRREAARHRGALASGYASVRRAFPGRLPRALDFRLVPTDTIGRFLFRAADAAASAHYALSLHDDLTRATNRRRQAWIRQSRPFAERVTALSDDEIARRIRSLDPNVLPANLGNQVRRARGMLVDPVAHRGYLTALLTKTLMFDSGSYPDLRAHNADVARLRGRLRAQAPPEPADLTQYDCSSGGRLFFPPAARGLSQHELRRRWKSLGRP
jgi:hypothetical protein